MFPFDDVIMCHTTTKQTHATTAQLLLYLQIVDREVLWELEQFYFEYYVTKIVKWVPVSKSTGPKVKS